MSILVADLKVYDYVCSGLGYVANNNTCDALYSGTIRKYLTEKDWVEESKRLTKSWLDMNERSYNLRYEKKNYCELSEFLSYTSTDKLTGIQLLKYLLCIQYNIEVDFLEDVLVMGKQQRDDMKILDTLNVMKYKLNKLESSQVIDAIKSGCTIKSRNKGWTNTPLFQADVQQKLF